MATMDAARTQHSAFGGPTRAVLPMHEAAPSLLQPEDFANILKLHPIERSRPERAVRPPALSARDISSALELVHEAAAVIRAADDRVRDSEARTHTLLQRAADELKAAQARAEAAEARAQAAEARAKEAQARAEEAENWLRQIFATISEELPGRR
jgi:FtsZ-binding cell division protein ZapB